MRLIFGQLKKVYIWILLDEFWFGDEEIIETKIYIWRLNYQTMKKKNWSIRFENGVIKKNSSYTFKIFHRCRYFSTSSWRRCFLNQSPASTSKLPSLKYFNHEKKNTKSKITINYIVKKHNKPIKIRWIDLIETATSKILKKATDGSVSTKNLSKNAGGQLNKNSIPATKPLWVA